jgi:hypothetical protein
MIVHDRIRLTGPLANTAPQLPPELRGLSIRDQGSGISF